LLGAKETTVPRLSMALCPACEQANADDATSCVACGTPLVTRCPACNAINVRTRSVCHRCRAALRAAAAPAPPHAWSPTLVRDDALNGPDTEPAVVLTLLDDALDGSAPAYWGNLPAGELARATLRAWAPPTPDPAALRWPRLDPAERPPQPPTPDLASDAGRVPPAAPPGTAAANAAAHADATPASIAASSAAAVAASMRQRAKAERRARVRQRQLRTQRDALGRAVGVPDEVLLLEPDTESRRSVCSVLEAFGFRPHVVASAREALACSLHRRYAAALLGLGHASDDDAAELCHRLRRLPPFGATPVFAIGDAGRHADRVRMQLAGAHDTLLRPVGRGALAHTLQTHGVVLPRDPRVGGPPATGGPGR
jgi:CheY-like chemotaxis protein